MDLNIIISNRYVLKKLSRLTHSDVKNDAFQTSPIEPECKL